MDKREEASAAAQQTDPAGRTDDVCGGGFWVFSLLVACAALFLFASVFPRTPSSRFVDIDSATLGIFVNNLTFHHHYDFSFSDSAEFQDQYRGWWAAAELPLTVPASVLQRLLRITRDHVDGLSEVWPPYSVWSAASWQNSRSIHRKGRRRLERRSCSASRRFSPVPPLCPNGFPEHRLGVPSLWARDLLDGSLRPIGTSSLSLCLGPCFRDGFRPSLPAVGDSSLRFDRYPRPLPPARVDSASAACVRRGRGVSLARTRDLLDPCGWPCRVLRNRQGSDPNVSSLARRFSVAGEPADPASVKASKACEPTRASEARFSQRLGPIRTALDTRPAAPSLVVCRSSWSPGRHCRMPASRKGNAIGGVDPSARSRILLDVFLPRGEIPSRSDSLLHALAARGLSLVPGRPLVAAAVLLFFFGDTYRLLCQDRTFEIEENRQLAIRWACRRVLPESLSRRSCVAFPFEKDYTDEIFFRMLTNNRASWTDTAEPPAKSSRCETFFAVCPTESECEETWRRGGFHLIAKSLSDEPPFALLRRTDSPGAVAR